MTSTKQDISFLPTSATQPGANSILEQTTGFTSGNGTRRFHANTLQQGFVAASFVYQNLPGPQMIANYTVTSGIAGVALNAGSVVARLVEPGSRYGERSNQFDVRLSKSIGLAGARRIRPEIGIYNVFNSNAILAIDTTYGPTWQRPTSLLAGRLAKLGVQVDF